MVITLSIVSIWFFSRKYFFHFLFSFLFFFFQENFVLEDDVLNLTSPDKYELVWFLPEDNGEPIDFFEISFYPVGFDANTQSWNRKGDLFRTEVPHPGNVRYVIQVKHVLLKINFFISWKNISSLYLICFLLWSFSFHKI